MTDDNNTVDIDQDDFENEFFGRTPEPEEPQDEVEEVEEVAETEEDNPLATDDDEDEDVEDEEDDDEEELEEVPQIKQKRNRTQERIEKLVAEARQAERERDALRTELEKLRADKEVKQKEEVPNVREQLPADAPNPDAKDENGDPIYELGEFDPKFVADLSRFIARQEHEAIKAQAEKEAHEARIREAQEELKTRWVDNVAKAEETLPDIREKLGSMAETFQDIDPNYGEYLASTIMNSEVGPQIMYYLSQNIGEAQKIVASGPVAATLALGRLEANILSSTRQEEKRNTKQVSKAPEPPKDIERARGHGGRFTVAPDTDDQSAFEREFFKR